jgi:hypothetical protein
VWPASLTAQGPKEVTFHSTVDRVGVIFVTRDSTRVRVTGAAVGVNVTGVTASVSGQMIGGGDVSQRLIGKNETTKVRGAEELRLTMAQITLQTDPSFVTVFMDAGSPDADGKSRYYRIYANDVCKPWETRWIFQRHIDKARTLGLFHLPSLP